MGKISPVSAKYIIHATIDIEGVVDKPDVIGAIFGQTEGLLGADLELRELQRSGRIGRIEVNCETRSGKTQGSIIIPSSLDKAETAIVGAAMEIIQRIGPCNAKIKIKNIEDVRVSKRSFVIDRAKELLKSLIDVSMPDSKELSDEVAYSVRVMEITEYGKDRLPAGPAIDESDEIIVVEGRADVVNLLKNGIKNAIAINGTSIPETIMDLSKKKIATAFVDGDRGGNLIIKELTQVADLDYVTKAPDGKEVEEITKKEIHKAIRSRISIEQAKMELGKEADKAFHKRPNPKYQNRSQQKPQQSRGQQSRSQQKPQQSRGQQPQKDRGSQPQRFAKKVQLNDEQKKAFKGMLEDLIGTRGAYILDNNLSILGKVPLTELGTTLRSVSSAHAIVFDGTIDKDIVQTAEKANVKYIVAMDTKIRPSDTKVDIITSENL
ncbi:DNA primase [Candidatus Woesearchaeota archaeon]|nr:DNA primase [Candidatus Woesearchaeota archaeon]